MSLDLDKHIETLQEGGCLPERDVRKIVDLVKEILIEESNV